MGRRRTGSVETCRDAGGRTYYRARITLADGTRERLPVPAGMSKARATDWAHRMQELEDRDGGLLARKQHDGAKLADLTGETFAAYVTRWLADRADRGVSSVDTEGGYLKKHVVPILGARPIRSIDRAAVEDVRDALDRKIKRGAFKHKTAANIWGLVTSLFSEATESKSRALRVLDEGANPTTGVKGPDKGEDVAKTFLYPDEFLRLVACDDVPLRFRRMFVLAVYLYARAGEINALEWGRGIDRARGVANITQQVDRRTAERRKTKTPAAIRMLPIEPNLDPLLAILEREAGGKGRVAQVSETDRKLALTLRRCLLLAGVDRPDLHERTESSVPITFHDLRATGITWCAVRGDHPQRLKQRAGHKTFSTTERYIRLAENLGAERFGEVFPPLPAAVLESATNRPAFYSERVKTAKNKR